MDSKSEPAGFTDSELEYIDFLQSSSGCVLEEEARRFAGLIHTLRRSGREAAVREFEALASDIIARSSPSDALFKVSFLSGCLTPAGICSREEAKKLSKRFGRQLKELRRQGGRK